MRGLFTVSLLLATLIAVSEASFGHKHHAYPHRTHDKMLHHPFQKSGTNVKLNIKVELNNAAGRRTGGSESSKLSHYHRKPFGGRYVPSHVHGIAQQIMSPIELSNNESVTILPASNVDSTVAENTNSTSNFTTFGNNVGLAAVTRKFQPENSTDNGSAQFHHPQHHVKWAASARHRGGDSKRWAGEHRLAGGHAHKTIVKLTIPIILGDMSGSSTKHDSSSSESDSSFSSSESDSKSSKEHKEDGSEYINFGSSADKWNGNGTQPSSPPFQPTFVRPEIDPIEQLTAALLNGSTDNMNVSNSSLNLNASNDAPVLDPVPSSVNDTVLTTNTSLVSNSNVTNMLLVAPPMNVIIPAENNPGPVSAMMPVEGVDIIPEAMATVDNSTTIAPQPKIEVTSTTTEKVSTTTKTYHFGVRKPKVTK